MRTATMIRAVEAHAQARLRITWQNGKTDEVDVSDFIGAPGYEALTDAALFAVAAVEEWGHAIEWRAGEIAIGADQLYRLAREQAGKAFPVEAFNAWMSRNGLSLAAAAQALGLSRRTIIYYHCGQKPIPVHIGLACRGWEAIQAERRAA